MQTATCIGRQADGVARVGWNFRRDKDNIEHAQLSRGQCASVCRPAVPCDAILVNRRLNFTLAKAIPKTRKCMFNNIQMLRAVAAAMVLLHHAAAHYQALGGLDLLVNLFSSVGFSGVDIFFVISGFVAAHTTLHKLRTLSNAWVFAKRRLLRIYLGYWPFFALTLAWNYVAFPGALAGFDIVSSFFLATIELKRLVIYVTWSLTFELLFYALVTISFFLSTRLVQRLVHVLALAVFAVLVWTYATPHSPLLLFVSMLLEFLSGVIIYIHREKLKSRWWIGPCLVGAAFAFASGARVHATDGSVRIFTFGVAAAALVMLAVVLEQTRTFVANRFWVGLGNSSYTLYLAHLSLLVAFYFLGIRGFLATQPGFVREAGFFLYVGFCFLITHWFYVQVESPLYRWASSGRSVAPPGSARQSTKTK